MKNKGLTTILALFFGVFGVHRFYLGQKFLGVLYIVLFFVFGLSFIISLIDVLGFLFMSKERFDYRYNRKYFEDDYLEFLKKRENLYGSGPPQRGASKNSPKKKITSRQEGVNNLKNEGIELFNNYEYEEAIERFEQVLAINSRDAAIHFNLACCFSLLENRERTLRHLALAVENGFDKIDQIHQLSSLAWIRVQPEWSSFVKNKFILTPPPLNSPKDDLLDALERDSNQLLTDELQLPDDDKLLVKLKKLKDLRDRGLISDIEFSREKKKIL